MGKKKIIEVKHVRKVYKMGKVEIEAVKDISLTVYENEFVSIMGPSGSGKSTLMNILGCLDTPTSGEYYLNGTLVSTLDDNDLAKIRNREIGFVFQTFNLLKGVDAIHNVELPLIYSGLPYRERIKRAEKTLVSVGLGNRIRHKPSELSGGQRQMVAIARALVNNPSILLADEPTGNLDSKTGEEILKLFHKLHREGNTILMVTHERDVALHAERIIHLRDGIIEYEEKVSDGVAEVI